MSKIQSLFQNLKKKYVRINLGEKSYKMRLLTLMLFSLAVVILLIAIIVLIIVNASSAKAVEPTSQFTEAVETAEPVNIDIEPEDPMALPTDDIEIQPTEEPAQTPEPSTEPTAEPTASSDAFTNTLKKGDSGEIVKVIQQRLVDLYYMDYPVQEKGSYAVTSKYGQASSDAIKLFQERNDITPTGECDAVTYEKLMAASASPYIMKKNDKCTMVKVIQTKLKEKGYMDKVTGLCGDDTITAVTNFQKANGLTPDGIAGPGTLKILLGH